MAISDQQYTDRVFLFTSITAVFTGVLLIAIGIASLVTDLLSTAMTTVAFSAGAWRSGRRGI